ncbi:MAG: hypothetical protein ACT6QS_00015 [Flavobacteriales bacterium]
MLINYYLGFAIILSAWLIFLILFYAIWKRTVRKKQSLGAGIGFFAGIGLSVFLFVWASNIYVATGNKEHKTFMSFGGGSYTLQNGSKISIDVPMLRCGVINDTPENLVLQKVIYGQGSSSSAHRDQLIKPGQLVQSEKEETNVDYFFDDAPPEHTVAGRDKKTVVELWLRTEADYGGFEKSPMQNMLDELRGLLNDSSAREGAESAE